MAAISHLWSLARIGRTLARYDVLKALDRAGPIPFPLKLGRALIALGAFKKAKTEPLGRRLAMALEDLGPAYVKLGQAMSTRADVVGVDIASHLRQLQDKVKPFPSDQAVAILETEFDQSVDAIFTTFNAEPVAAASIAQVHRGQTKDGLDVAIKILRPGIEARFAKDLALFRWTAEKLENWHVKSRRLRPVAVVDALSEMVARELDLRLEASAASELGEAMLGEEGYHIPAVDWARTTRRVLTTKWVEGVSLSDIKALEKAGIETRPLATKLVQIFLTQAMRDGFFHADLHQGNLLVTKEGVITAVDFGIVGRLDLESRRYLAEILYGFLKRDYRRIAQIHFDAGYVPAHHRVEDFAAAMRAIGEPIMGKPVKDISAAQLLAQLFATTERFDMETQPHLILLQKTMVMVEGLALTLDSEINMWKASEPVLEGWMRDFMGVEAQAADAIHDVLRLIRRLPDMLDHKGHRPMPQPVIIQKTPFWSLLLASLGGAALLFFLLHL